MYDDGSLNSAEIRTVLQAAIERAGGQQALSRYLRVAQRDISNAVTGRRGMSHRLARALGFIRRDQRHEYYIPVPEAIERTRAYLGLDQQPG